MSSSGRVPLSLHLVGIVVGCVSVMWFTSLVICTCRRHTLVACDLSPAWSGCFEQGRLCPWGVVLSIKPPVPDAHDMMQHFSLVRALHITAYTSSDVKCKTTVNLTLVCSVVMMASFSKLASYPSTRSLVMVGDPRINFARTVGCRQLVFGGLSREGPADGAAERPGR